jgi:putative membrane protein
MKKSYLILIVLFLAVWVWAAIHPKYPADWLLENYLVFFFVPVILLTGRYFRLSLVSYTLLTVFMCLHVIGSHYTYAEVPFGYTLQNWLGSQRNMYDRVVHFGFGFLLAYPMREMFVRLAKVKGFWGYLLPLNLVLALSALYELMEWLTAVIVSPDAGSAFLGTQGDEWDAQKDMGAAGVGALLAMTVIVFINARLDKHFWRDWRGSFHLRKDDEPLGEVKLRKMLGGD